MASTLEPGTSASTQSLSSSRFLPMISLPASPKPSASREPSLMIAFSRIFVSIEALFFCRIGRLAFLPVGLMDLTPFSFLSSGKNPSSLDLRVPACGAYCWSAKRMAYKGSCRMISTLLIIRSIGSKTSWSASLLKSSAPTARTSTTNAVWTMLRMASHSTSLRRSKTKTNWPSMCCLKKSALSTSGTYQVVSCSRSWFRGHGRPGMSETPTISALSVECCLLSSSVQRVIQGLFSADLISSGRPPTLYIAKLSSSSVPEKVVSHSAD
mmetsp:Transcript_1787/g.5670  ORF Transcript_1787/g.5670 Transcript_1787/m.5670 type:complete len:268 (-) Transcript_1787:1171-1974(-)